MSPNLLLPLIKRVSPNAQLPGQIRRRFAGLHQQTDGFRFKRLGKTPAFSHGTHPGALSPFLVSMKRGVAQYDHLEE
jgi:hypothetical protein